jgi:hypothetical protein
VLSALVGPWLWLFPATYIVHILEEALAGERFHRWIGRVLHRALTLRAFLALNAVLLAAMVAATIAIRAGRAFWLLPCLGAITAINGIGHAAGTALTRRYSPGTVSGLVLWLPLGLAALALSRPALPMGIWLLGVAAGILISAAVALVAFKLSRLSSP